MQGEWRIALVVDQVLVRDGLRALLESQCCSRVVAEVGSPAEVPRDVSCDCVIYVCLRRSARTVEFARELAPVPLLVMTGEADPEGLGRDLEAGVRGFVPVTVGMEELRTIVVRVCRGERFLHPALATASSPQASLLTGREQEVLDLLQRGLPVAEIAGALDMSPSTVRTHLRSLLRKRGWDPRGEEGGGSLVPRVPRAPVRGPGREAEWPE